MAPSQAFKGLNGKIAVLVGGTGGIGTAASRRLSQEGAAVVIGDLNGAEAEKLAAELRGQGAKAIGAGCDVSKPQDISELFAVAVEEFGGVDLLFANAADVSSPIHKARSQQ